MTTLRRIRGGSGLGDSLYLRPIVDHFLLHGDRVQVMSNYSDIFIGSKAEVEPFGRKNINVVAHYSWAKNNQATNQWQDICANARLPRVLPLRINWRVRNEALIEKLRAEAGDREIVLVHGGRIPMGRTDGFGKEILPAQEAFNFVLKKLKHCYTVRIGEQREQLYEVQTNRRLLGTSVSDLLDVAVSCKALVGQCSFIVPLAEVFDKPLLTIWANSGLHSSTAFVRLITPRKVLSKSSSWYVQDNWAPERIDAVLQDWIQFAGLRRRDALCAV